MITKKESSAFQEYLVDAANVKGSCETVYIPENREELIELIKTLYENKTEYTISGRRTSLTGSSIPVKGVIISTERLRNRFIIDEESLTLKCEPGYLISEIKTELSKAGLFYAPDPTEDNSTIGGNIATNASGAKSFKYGAARKHVLELEIVLTDGEVYRLKRGENIVEQNLLKLKSINNKEKIIRLPEIKTPHTKNAAGYYLAPNMDAIDLFIGAEGTLGTITEATLRVFKKKENLLSFIIYFESTEICLNFIDEIRRRSLETRKGESFGLEARAIEYFDKNSLILITEDFPHIPEDTQCAVWTEQELQTANEEQCLLLWSEIFEQYCIDENKIWVATDETEREKMHKMRHSVPLKVNEYISRNNYRKIGTDSAVPQESFRYFYSFSEGAVKESGLKYVIYGHFGDCHIHLNMLPETEEQFELGLHTYTEICKKAITLGGTLSAEHGIGKIKTKYFEIMYTKEEIAEMAKIKKYFDPNLQLNRGNIFSENLLLSVL